MSTMTDDREQSRVAQSWAKPVMQLHFGDVPDGATNINVDGPPPDLADPGLREDVAEDLHRGDPCGERDSGRRRCAGCAVAAEQP